MTATNHLTSPVYRQNYQRLEALLGQPIPDLRPETVYRLRAEGFMDLVLEVLSRDRGTGAVVLSLAHYFEQHGDLCQDPEMVVRAFPPTEGESGLLEALTFRQAIPPIYHEVYPEPGKVIPRLRRELNEFLTTWLRNLKAQGHQPVRDSDWR
jgi:hypothetical protein